MSDRFTRDNAYGTILLDWWQKLEDDRANRAILRRTATVTAVALSAPYQRLYHRFRIAGWNPDGIAAHDDRLAAIVGLLAHVAGVASSNRPGAVNHHLGVVRHGDGPDA